MAVFDYPCPMPQMELPSLVDQQGPPFYAPIDSEPGLTQLGFWDESGSKFQVDRNFECLAGQATFNPARHPGVRLFAPRIRRRASPPPALPPSIRRGCA